LSWLIYGGIAAVMAKRQKLISGDFVVAALYRFVDLPDYADLRQPVQLLCETNRVRGTLLLAPEGINGTIAGTGPEIETVLEGLKALLGLADLEHKESRTDTMPFARLKVRLKKEIVTMGVAGIDPSRQTGAHVEPADWNALLDDPDLVLIDTRNAYEVAIGTFEGAISPETNSFREFPQWARDSEVLKGKPRVAMFCTGGIRCEKAAALLRQDGFEEVYQLKGGILKYLETVPKTESRWNGECFVFDERVSVGDGLKPGNYQLCRACRMPLGEADIASPHYQEGISCPHCIDRHSDADRARFAERQKQIERGRKG
jgi:UPF0176 protein